MSLHWEGEAEGRLAAIQAASALAELKEHQTSAPIVIGNEFAEIRITRVETRNGSRLLVESTKSGQWIALCPLELEALTWQSPATFSAMLGKPFGPLFEEDE